MLFCTNDTHRVQQRHVALVVVRRIRVELKTIVLYCDLGKARCAGLTEHTGEEVEIVLHIVMLTISQHIWIVGIFSLHSVTVMRRVAFATTGSTDKIESTIIGTIRTSLISCHILFCTTCHLLSIRDS